MSTWIHLPSYYSHAKKMSRMSVWEVFADGDEAWSYSWRSDSGRSQHVSDLIHLACWAGSTWRGQYPPKWKRRRCWFCLWRLQRRWLQRHQWHPPLQIPGSWIVWRTPGETGGPWWRTFSGLISSQSNPAIIGGNCNNSDVVEEIISFSFLR